MKSLFITFEGIEGSGKSTQIQLLKDYFSEKGFSTFLYREPGGTEFGEALRSAILKSTTKISPIAEAMLFASSRAQLIAQEILPKLEEENNLVIVDRFIDSSLAYQGHGRGQGFETIESLHNFGVLKLRPDLTFYLKISLECSLERQAKRNQGKDYFESEQNEFHEKLIEGFDLLSKRYADRIKVIDGEKDQVSVFNSILENIKDQFPNVRTDIP